MNYYICTYPTVGSLVIFVVDSSMFAYLNNKGIYTDYVTFESRSEWKVEAL